MTYLVLFTLSANCIAYVILLATAYFDTEEGASGAFYFSLVMSFFNILSLFSLQQQIR